MLGDSYGAAIVAHLSRHELRAQDEENQRIEAEKEAEEKEAAEKEAAEHNAIDNHDAHLNAKGENQASVQL